MSMNTNTNPTKRTPDYVCSICGKKYTNPVDRATCELKCSEEIEKAKKEKEKKKFEAEKTEAYNKIVRQMEELTAALKSYNEKYGLYRANKTNFINFPLMSASAFWDNILKF